MKRNLFAVFAIVLAIAASAFTNRQPVKSKALQPALFWYTISSSGTLAGPVNSMAVDKDTEKAAFPDCDDTDNSECLLGTDSNQDAGSSVGIVDPNANYHIRRTANP